MEFHSEKGKYYINRKLVSAVKFWKEFKLSNTTPSK